MTPLTKAEIEEGVRIVQAGMMPTPQYAWPLLCQAVGTEFWLKHENHTPTGAFKIRGGLTFIRWLKMTCPEVTAIVSATRGNHGQSLALAGEKAGLDVTIVVPHGNSRCKNDAMRGLGARLIEHGEDYDAAKAEAERIADEDGAYFVPGFHRELVRGVSSWAYELFTAVPDLDVLYVPVGAGSGACGAISVRDALGLDCEIVGVISDQAQSAALSVAAGRAVTTEGIPRTFADGVAVRGAFAEALGIYATGLSRFVTVTDEEVADAVRLVWSTTRNIGEGAGVAGIAAAMKEEDAIAGKKAATVLCGGNIDTDWLITVLQGGVPRV